MNEVSRHVPGPSFGTDRAAIEHVDSLPRQKNRADWTIRHGYAVNLNWAGRDEWFFYTCFEAAWVFLRAARMGEAIEGEVCYAANEYRYRESRGDYRTLYVGDQIRYWDVDEPELLRHFMTQVNQRSKYAGPGQAPGAYQRPGPE